MIRHSVYTEPANTVPQNVSICGSQPVKVYPFSFVTKRKAVKREKKSFAPYHIALCSSQKASRHWFAPLPFSAHASLALISRSRTAAVEIPRCFLHWRRSEFLLRRFFSIPRMLDRRRRSAPAKVIISMPRQSRGYNCGAQRRHAAAKPRI